MAGFICSIESLSKFLSWPWFIFLIFIFKCSSFFKITELQTHGGQSHVCTRLAGYLLDWTTRIPFAAFLSNHSPAGSYTGPLISSLLNPIDHHEQKPSQGWEREQCRIWSSSVSWRQSNCLSDHMTPCLPRVLSQMEPLDSIRWTILATSSSFYLASPTVPIPSI